VINRTVSLDDQFGAEEPHSIGDLPLPGARRAVAEAGMEPSLAMRACRPSCYDPPAIR
jgi:hypothetical protein